ncbi:MAG: competence/damage-inducible protein A [Spirochaetia bacterium]|nr:competence/damage-inducible protein A [Spirochaetia bacterium]
MKAEVLTVGTELLLGQILDTNSLFLSKKLAEIGIDLYFKTSVGDNVERVQQALSTACLRADVVIITGGLGPTVDDVTRESVAKFAGSTLVTDEKSLRGIEEYFAKRSLRMPENNRKQAKFPDGAIVMENPNGSAPGFILEHGQNILIAMPGVPSEMYPMMEKQVMPYLVRKMGKVPMTIRSRSLRVMGMGESLVDEAIQDLFKNSTNPTIGVYAHDADIEIRLTAKAPDAAKAADMIEKLREKIAERLGANVIGEDDDTIEDAAGRELKRLGFTLSTAESCTAGLVAHTITAVAGSSEYYIGGINSYANRIKNSMLFVPEELLEKYGAVSEECAAAMAAGCNRAFKTDAAISVTGIAGPGGGSAEKPVGLVYIGVDIRGKNGVFKRNFGGSRKAIRNRAAQTALFLLYQQLKDIVK